MAAKFFFLLLQFLSWYLIKLSGGGAGAEIWTCGSLEPEQKEIFSAPQHCFKV
jgi:hypothetical protein